MIDAPTASAHPIAAVGAYAEPIVRGRRVALIGDATAGIGELLLDRGARHVHVFDPDPGRVAEAAARQLGPSGQGRRPIVARWTDDLGVRDGAFDVVVAVDLAAIGEVVDVVQRVRRMVASGGVAMLVSPNPDAETRLSPARSSAPDTARVVPTYYDLYDAVSLQFPDVRMLGQAPFVGYAIVDFAEAEPEVTVDASLLDDPETPEWYIAVASDRSLDIEPYALVELPSSSLLSSARRPSEAPYTARASHAPLSSESDQPVTVVRDLPGRFELELELREANARVTVLSTEIDNLREELARSKQNEDAAERAELQRSEEGLRQRVGELEVRLLDEHHRAEEAIEGARGVAAEVLRLRAELEDAAALQVRLRAENTAHRERIAVLESDAELERLPTLRSREAQARLEQLVAREHDLSSQLARAQSAAAEHASLVERLRGEAASRSTDLERARKRADDAEAQLARTNRSNEERRADLEATKQRAFELEGELERALGRVTELEDELEAAQVTLEAARVTLAEQRAETAGSGALTSELEGEIARLESALRERGREVARLSSELREGERIGKELLLALQAAGALESDRPQGGGAPSTGPSSPRNEAATIDAARSSSVESERSARLEADLVAAGWRITQLERELARRSRPDEPPTVREQQLERALIIAQRELAEARGLARTSRDAASTSSTDGP